jgi:putative oxidoreductase
MRLKIQTEAKLRDLSLLWLRVTIGSFMLVHGIPKMQTIGDDPVLFADPFGLGPSTSLLLAVFAEVFCSVALILGLMTRAACVPLIVTMLVAAVMIHAGDPWAEKEFALLYALPYVTLLLAGPGRFSLDARLFKRK